MSGTDGARRIEANGLSFRLVDQGEGEPVLLLHGFPDSAELWAPQIDALAGAGYRVIAPDLRGFGESDKPDDVAAYAAPNLLADVAGILDAVGVERCRVVGHDWGAFLAWATAAFFPDRVDKLVAVSVGHPAAFSGAGWEQREKSWYMLWFQFPGIAEEALARNDFELLSGWARGQGDLDRWRRDLSRPGALTAGLNWYRANISPETFLGGSDAAALPPARCATMGIWSDGDFALVEQQMVGSEQFVEGEWRYERIDGAGHWIQLDAPDRLNELLVDFLGA